MRRAARWCSTRQTPPGQYSRPRLIAKRTRAVASAAFRLRPAVTKDGTRIALNLNAGSADELEGLDPAICDGIGLVRTEFLFHGPAGLPDEDAQYQAYRRIVAWADGRPVTIRTLDAGGDKPIPGVTAGWRKQSVPRPARHSSFAAPSGPISDPTARLGARGGARRTAHHAADGDRARRTRGGRKLLGEAVASLAHDNCRPAGPSSAS